MSVARNARDASRKTRRRDSVASTNAKPTRQERRRCDADGESTREKDQEEEDARARDASTERKRRFTITHIFPISSLLSLVDERRGSAKHKNEQREKPVTVTL